MWPTVTSLEGRPVSSSWPDATPIPQVRASLDRPLLTVSDRQLPILRACGGHGRRERSWHRPGSDGHKLNRRVRSVQDDHLPCWQAAGAARQVGSAGRRAGLIKDWPPARESPCRWEGRPGRPTLADGVWACALRRAGTSPPSEVSDRGSQQQPNPMTGAPICWRRSRPALGYRSRLAKRMVSWPILLFSGGSERSPHDFVGLLGLIGIPGPPSCLAC
jgi:hypothetical protein